MATSRYAPTHEWIRLDSLQQRLQLPYYMSLDPTARNLVINWSQEFLRKFHIRGQIVDHGDTPIADLWVIEFPDYDRSILAWENFAPFILDLVIKLSEIFTYETWIGTFVYQRSYADTVYYEFTNKTLGSENVKTLLSTVGTYQVGSNYIIERRSMDITRVVPLRRPLSPRRR